ncbi:MAG: DUF2975 domain-containing protein [Haliea sp.]|nr:DUF2975 domain-containing protein [Haliea sp.]
MNPLEKIQRVSGVLRTVLLAAALVIGGSIALGLTNQELFILGDGQLNELRQSGLISPALSLAMMAPFGVVLVLGVFWLQRLFSEYHQGHFFTNASMRCIVWLVWLKAAAFLYGIFWPLLLMAVAPIQDIGLTIEAGTLVELVVLLLIVHLLKAAQQINDENKAFV